MSGLAFYDNFLAKVSDSPSWSPASEQVRSSVTICVISTHLILTISSAQILVEPYTYLSKAPGKEVRSALIAAFNEWMHVEKEELAIVTKVVGMLHTASLL